MEGIEQGQRFTPEEARLRLDEIAPMGDPDTYRRVYKAAELAFVGGKATADQVQIVRDYEACLQVLNPGTSVS